jgi:hypothetical protein
MVCPLSESPTCPGHATPLIFESPSPTTLRPSASSTAMQDLSSAALRRRWVLSPVPTTSAPTRLALPFPAKLRSTAITSTCRSPNRDGLPQRHSVSDLQGPERPCRRPEQFRIARLAQQARRARALDPRGVPCLTSSGVLLRSSRPGHAAIAIAATSASVDGRELFVMPPDGFRRTKRSD